MRKQGDTQKNIYKWKITKYLNENKDVELSTKLYRTIKEVNCDFPELTSHRVCNHLRGMSAGKLGKSKELFRDLKIEKLRIEI